MATIYYVIGTASGWSTPTAAEVKAGQLAGGSAATAAGSETAPESLPTNFTFSVPAVNLPIYTYWRMASVWSNGDSNSNVVVSDVFHTLNANRQMMPFDRDLIPSNSLITLDTNNKLLDGLYKFSIGSTVYSKNSITKLNLPAGEISETYTSYGPALVGATYNGLKGMFPEANSNPKQYSSLSVFIDFKVNGTLYNAQRKIISGGSYTPIIVANEWTADQLYIGLGADADFTGYTYLVATSGISYDNTRVRLLFTWDSTVGIVTIWEYINNTFRKTIGSTSKNTTILMGGNSRLESGILDVNSSTNISIISTGMWERRIPEQEVLAILNNSKQLFKPRKLQIPVTTPIKKQGPEIVIRKPISNTINYNNPITRGLKSCVLPGITGWIDLVDGITWQNSQYNSLSKLERYLGSINTTGIEIKRPISGSLMNMSSFLHVGKWIGSTDYNSRNYPGIQSSAMDKYIRTGIPHYSIDFDWGIFDDDYSSNFSTVQPSGQIALSNKACIIVTNNISNKVSAAVNGSYAENIPTSLSSEVVQYISAGSNWRDNIIYILAYWNRPLSISEQISISINPWQLFQPRRIQLHSNDVLDIPNVPNLQANVDNITNSSARPFVQVNW